MATPRRFLVATDFSAGAACASDTAIALARRFGARIDWVHVGPDAPRSLSPSSDAALTHWIDHAHREAANGLDALEKQAEDAGIESAVHLHAGRPEVAVAHCVEETGADWVIVGTHGRSGIRALLLGSVAEKIVRNSPVNVLCVRSGARLEKGGIIVFGEDLASAERRRVVADLARSLESRILAVHAVELAPAVMADASFSPPPALLESSVSEAREQLTELRDAYGEEASTVVCLGNASDALCDQARRHNAILLVTGTASRSGLERWMLGSVAEKTLRHAPCSVLVLKP